MTSEINRRQTLGGMVLGGMVLGGAAEAAAGSDERLRGVLTRLIGPKAGHFRLRVEPDPGSSTYAWQVRGGKVIVTGSSPVAALRGAYAYLTAAGLAYCGWDGQRADMPARLPDLPPAKVRSAFGKRAYLNTCTFGYTTPFWDWPRWQREIDFMAFHGIDMPLAMEGQEHVWRALWREEGLEAAELEDYFSGPAFLPWQRMGNIEGYQTPLPDDWIERKRDLQVRILKTMRGLGMEPVLPAFGGYVPRAFAEKHPQARIFRMRPWEGFHETYWLDPADPLFARLAGRFLDIYEGTYGKGRYFLADSFNEMLPPVNEPSAGASGAYGDAEANTGAASAPDPEVVAGRLAAYGRRIHDSIRAHRPDAVWVMQGWLFGADQTFWTRDAISAFLRDVPDEGMLVLDIGNDRYPNTRRTAGNFHGKGWIYGYVQNYGGSNPVYGDLPFYRDDLAGLAANADNGNLKGFGVFPEGLECNGVVYDYLYDLAWGDAPASLGDWLARYTRARYGASSPKVVEAWLDIVRGVFRTRYWTPRWWRSIAGAYLICKRPDVSMSAFEGAPGDRAALAAGLSALIDAGREGGAPPLLLNDIAGFTCHLASLRLDDLIRSALSAYAAKDVTGGDRAASEVARLALAVDSLLGVQPFSLASWIAQARAYGDTPALKDLYERNARLQVTLWGGKGNLHDYASKAWQGMYAGFYLPRWQAMFDALRMAATGGAAFDSDGLTARTIAWEHAWAETPRTVDHVAPADPLADAASLLASLGA